MDSLGSKPGSEVAEDVEKGRSMEAKTDTTGWTDDPLDTETSLT